MSSKENDSGPSGQLAQKRRGSAVFMPKSIARNDGIRKPTAVVRPAAPKQTTVSILSLEQCNLPARGRRGRRRGTGRTGTRGRKGEPKKMAILAPPEALEGAEKEQTELQMEMQRQQKQQHTEWMREKKRKENKDKRLHEEIMKNRRDMRDGVLKEPKQNNQRKRKMGKTSGKMTKRDKEKRERFRYKERIRMLDPMKKRWNTSNPFTTFSSLERKIPLRAMRSILPPITKEMVDNVPKDLGMKARFLPSTSIQNVVMTFNLSTGTFDLMRLLNDYPHMSHNPGWFAAVVELLKEPFKCTALQFASGSTVCTGTKSETEGRRAMAGANLLSAQHGVPCSTHNLRIENLVASASVGFSIDLDRMHKTMRCDLRHGNVRYEPTLFPGLTYRVADLAVFLVFPRGNIVITGTKNREMLSYMFCWFYYSVLVHFKSTTIITNSSKYRANCELLANNNAMRAIAGSGNTTKGKGKRKRNDKKSKTVEEESEVEEDESEGDDDGSNSPKKKKKKKTRTDNFNWKEFLSDVVIPETEEKDALDSDGEEETINDDSVPLHDISIWDRVAVVDENDAVLVVHWKKWMAAQVEMARYTAFMGASAPDPEPEYMPFLRQYCENGYSGDDARIQRHLPPEKKRNVQYTPCEPSLEMMYPWECLRVEKSTPQEIEEEEAYRKTKIQYDAFLRTMDNILSVYDTRAVQDTEQKTSHVIEHGVDIFQYPDRTALRDDVHVIMPWRRIHEERVYTESQSPPPYQMRIQ